MRSTGPDTSGKWIQANRQNSFRLILSLVTESDSPSNRATVEVQLRQTRTNEREKKITLLIKTTAASYVRKTNCQLDHKIENDLSQRTLCSSYDITSSMTSSSDKL